MKAELSNDIKQLMKDALDGKLTAEEIEENIEAVNAVCSLTKALEKDRYDTFNKILEKDRYTYSQESEQVYLAGVGLVNTFFSFKDNETNERFCVINVRSALDDGNMEAISKIVAKDIRNGWVYEQVSYMPAETLVKVIDGWYGSMKGSYGKIPKLKAKKED